jgi:hypothetical protein
MARLGGELETAARYMDEGAAILAELAFMKLLSINPQPLQARRLLRRARKLSERWHRSGRSYSRNLHGSPSKDASWMIERQAA